jgi:hypothetical protein
MTCLLDCPRSEYIFQRYLESYCPLLSVVAAYCATKDFRTGIRGTIQLRWSSSSILKRMATTNQRGDKARE